MIQSPRPIQSTVRFGSQAAVKPLQNGVSNALYHTANAVFNASNRSETLIKKYVPFTWLQKPMKAFFKTILAHDYHGTPSFFSFGHWVAEPPIGALTLTLFGPTLAGRLVHAYKRAKDNDYREMRDIVIRDVPTFLIILYLLPNMQRWVSKGLQKMMGMQLVGNNGKVFTYSQLKDIYSITENPNRLVALLSNPSNKEGMLTAIARSSKNKHATPQMKTLLSQFEAAIQKGFDHPSEKEIHADKAFGLLKRLAEVRNHQFKPAYPAAKINPLRHQMYELLHDKLPIPSKMFYSYARRMRVWVDGLSILTVVGLLGFGVTAFNQWFTEKEYRRKKLDLFTPSMESQPTLFPTQDSAPLQGENPWASYPNAYYPPYFQAPVAYPQTQFANNAPVVKPVS